MTDRAALLRQAAGNLAWCNTIPHTIDHIVGVARETARLDREANSVPSAGRAYGDPTAGAAATMEAERTEPKAVTSIDATAQRAHDSARDIDHLISDTLGMARWSPTAPIDRRGWVRDAEARIHHCSPHLPDAVNRLDVEWTDYLDQLVRSLAEDAAWLRRKGEGIIGDARPTSLAPVEQKPLKGCVSCARDTDTPDHKPYFEPVAAGRYADRCRACGDYKAAEKADPPKYAVWWMHHHGKRWTTKVLTDAKSPARRVR